MKCSDCMATVQQSLFIYIYIYIYIERERERESLSVQYSRLMQVKEIVFCYNLLFVVIPNLSVFLFLGSTLSLTLKLYKSAQEHQEIGAM